MLQRIQTVFLGLSTVSTFGFFGFDAAETEQAMTGSKLFADAHFLLFDDILLTVIFALAGLIFLADIFLFRNRPLQIKLSNAGVVLTLIGLAYGGFLWFSDSAAELAEPEPGLALPSMAIVFGILAARSIRKDEKLVRSADRLR